MQLVSPDGLQSLRPLFATFPGVKGALDAAFEGRHGDVLVDDALNPRVASIAIDDFYCIGGDPTASSAAGALLDVPFGGFLSVPSSWRSLVPRTIASVFPYQRFVFSAPKHWDRHQLALLRESLPKGFQLSRIDAATLEAFRALNRTFVANFPSIEDFLRQGVGFGVRDERTGQMVAGCSAFTISSGKLEVEIETRREYQRRGFALVTGARMIEHCLDSALEPCWDAAHEGSAVLAERLGFVGRRRYTAYRVGKPAGPPLNQS